jgi:hypothetical protein
MSPVGCRDAIPPVPTSSQAKTGVPFDDFIRDQRSAYRICDRRSRCSQEARLVAVADRSVSDLLRSDDHADCGARADDRVAARTDSRALPRQHRVVRRQDEGSAGACRFTFGPDPGSRDPVPVIPDAVVPYPVNPCPVNPGPFDPAPVNPGSNQSGPVFPGRTTTWRAEPVSQAETSVPDAVEAGSRSGGRLQDPNHHLVTIEEHD